MQWLQGFLICPGQEWGKKEKEKENAEKKKMLHAKFDSGDYRLKGLMGVVDARLDEKLGSQAMLNYR